MSPIGRAALLAPVLLIFGTSLGAQAESGSPPCADPAHRQFDFWIGTWDVETPDGKRAGENTITVAFDGCVIAERWNGVRGMSGASYNIYDVATGLWHQTWVDNRGLLLQLDGRLHGDAMVLEGTRPGTDSVAVKHRVRWEPLPDERVRQLWSVSHDGGTTWTVVFEGLYTRR